MAAGKHSHYDIVIVGGGVTGNALALALRSCPLRVAVIEAVSPLKSTSPDPERVIALSCGSSRYLDHLGVWKEISAEGAASINEVHVTEPGGRGMVHMDRAQAKVEALGYVVELPRITRILFEHAKRDVKVFCPARMLGMSMEGEKVSLFFRDRRGKHEISASLVVGADGTYSRVRTWAGIHTLGWDHNRFALVASVLPERPHRGRAFECFRPSGPLALLPLDERRCSIVWTLKPEEASRHLLMEDARFLTALTRSAGSEVRGLLGRILETGRRITFPLEFRIAERNTGHRLVLIGNAAHTIHPVAGQGLNLGLRDVGVLADVLSGALRAGRDVGESIVLEEYADRRRLDQAAVACFTEGLNGLFSNDVSVLRFLRQMGLDGMQRIPSARDWLMRQASGMAQLKSMGLIP